MTVDKPIEEGDVRELLRSVLLEENLQNPSIEFHRGSNVGDGFLGITNAVEVTGDNKKLKLFVKAAPKDKSLREAVRSRIVFTREIYFYRDVLPVFDSVLEKHDEEKLNLTPKCYATNSEENKEIVLFENLKERGFELHNKKQYLDEEHILLVLRSYAKFHGVSYILRHEFPNIFQELSEELADDIVDFAKHFHMVELLKSSIKTVREHNRERINIETLDRVETLIDETYEFLENCANMESDHKVIIHGDCWVNNMLFKYEGNNKIPVEVKLLDFQLSRINLPVFDLSFFFYCSAASVENLARLEFYLEYYHKHLSLFLQKFCLDANKVYPYKVFKEHWKEFGRYGIFVALQFTKLVLSEADEIPNIAKRVESAPTNHGEAFSIELSNNDKYVERIANILNHFVENKFI